MTQPPPLPAYLSYFDPAWTGHAATIILRLRRFLGKHQRIEHVGSTSIPGMVAKPIIDLDILYQDDLAGLLRTLATAGYQHQGDLGIAGREAFRSDPPLDLPAHHLYACAVDSAEARKHLGFRDHLRSHPERARWLSERKIALAVTRRLTRDQYISEKAPYYAEIMAEIAAGGTAVAER